MKLTAKDIQKLADNHAENVNVTVSLEDSGFMFHFSFEHPTRGYMAGAQIVPEDVLDLAVNPDGIVRSIVNQFEKDYAIKIKS